MRILRRNGPRAIMLLGLLMTASACSGVYIANQVAARASSGLGSQDRDNIDAGNIGVVRDRYEALPPSQLLLRQHTLLCDIYLKYQELGRAGECLDAVAARLATEPDNTIARAMSGKRAMLALALGQPETALRLIGDADGTGADYVRALALLRTGKTSDAHAITRHLARSDEPGPLYYAASLYAAMDDYTAASTVLRDPRGRLLKDYGLEGFTDTFGIKTGPGVFRLDVFDEFDFGLFGHASLAPAGNVYVEYLAALCALRLGDRQEAQRRLDAVLALPGIAAYRDVYWRVLTNRAELARQAGDNAMAEDFARRAVDAIEQVRNSVASEAARIAVAADHSAPYAMLVDLLSRRGDAAGALVFAEREHSRTLVEILAGRAHFANAHPAHATADRLIARYDCEAGESQIAAQSIPAAARLRQAQVEATRRQLLETAPEVADLVTVAPVDLSAIQARLGAKEAVLVFSDGPETWHVFTVQRGQIIEHAMSARDVVQPATMLSNMLSAQITQGWQESASALYRTAIAPAIEGLSADNLVIIPSGVLHYVPFAALGDGQHFLNDRFALRTVPNLNLLTRSLPGNRGERALVIGNPLKGNPALSLVFAEQEARDLATRLPNAELLIGADATIRAFQAAASGRDLIHFAGHGEFNPSHPLDSRLLFSTADGRPDDLTARALYDMRLDANLVFLNACETGRNYLAGGQDIVGLERGFFYSGAGAVIASLWKVDDKATSMLVRLFYTAWLGGATPEQALRTAQIATRAAFPHPSMWAAFELSAVGSHT